MKGQVYLLIGVLTVLALLSLRSLTPFIQTRPETTIKDDFFNLRNELVNAVDVSLLNESSPQKLMDNLNDFAGFARDAYSQRGYKLNSVYSFAYNASRISVGNFLGESMTGVSVTLLPTGETQNIPLINDGQSVLLSFTQTQGEFTVVVNSNVKSFYYKGLSSPTDGSVSQYFYNNLTLGSAFIKDSFYFNRTINK